MKKVRQLILEKHVKEKDHYQTVKQLYETETFCSSKNFSYKIEFSSLCVIPPNSLCFTVLKIIQKTNRQ